MVTRKQRGSQIKNILKEKRQVFIQNGYASREMDFVLAQKGRKTSLRRKEEETIKGVAVVPYCSSVTNQLSRLLHRKNHQNSYMATLKDLAPDVEYQRSPRFDHPRHMQDPMLMWK